MKRLQIYIEEELDDALAAEAARTKASKAALIRRYVAERLTPRRRKDPIEELIGTLDIEPVDPSEIDDVVYGS